MSIADEILRIQQAKQAIKEAINNKGGTLTNETIDAYAQAIDNLPSGGRGTAYEVHARALYLISGKSNQFEAAWEHSLIVDPLEISGVSTSGNPRGKDQYPDGDTEGVIIPQGITSIGNYAFSGWTSNNQPLVIPDSVTSIGSAALLNWSSNNQLLVIPDSVTSIGTSAFQNWSANKQPLVIPDSITSIGGSAFGNWILVPYIEMKGTTPPTITGTSFGYQNDAPIYVPDESVNDYKTATNWVNLASRIFSINDK